MDWNKTDNEILQLLSQLTLTDENRNAVSDDKRTNCADYLTETIRNISQYLNDNKTQWYFSPHIVNVSLALYLRNKKGYKYFRNSGIVHLPVGCTLQHITKIMYVHLRWDPKIYFMMNDVVNNIKEVITGQIMMYEIKLKNGIMLN